MLKVFHLLFSIVKEHDDASIHVSWFVELLVCFNANVRVYELSDTNFYLQIVATFISSRYIFINV